MSAWLRRGRAGWALLAAAAALAAFYALVAHVALGARRDEAWRRTFATGEFAVFPRSPVFGGRDGLAYRPGVVVEVAEAAGRRHLARFDWWRFHPTPWLKTADGRVFLSIPPALRRPDRPHRLELALACAYPSGEAARLVIAVNGAPVAKAYCAAGPVTVAATLPPGLVGARDYEEIRIARPGLSWRERALIRLGLRLEAVALERFSVTTE